MVTQILCDFCGNKLNNWFTITHRWIGHDFYDNEYEICQDCKKELDKIVKELMKKKGTRKKKSSENKTMAYSIILDRFNRKHKEVMPELKSKEAKK